MKKRIRFTVLVIASFAIIGLNFHVLSERGDILNYLNLNSLITNAHANIEFWDISSFIDEDNEPRDPAKAPADGKPCFAPYTRTTTVGGYTEIHNSVTSTDGTTVTINFDNIGSSSSFSQSTSNGTTEGMQWSVEESTRFIGYETICVDNFVLLSNYCREISCFELLHTRY